MNFQDGKAAFEAEYEHLTPEDVKAIPNINGFATAMMSIQMVKHRLNELIEEGSPEEQRVAMLLATVYIASGEAVDGCLKTINSQAGTIARLRQEVLDLKQAT